MVCSLVLPSNTILYIVRKQLIPRPPPVLCKKVEEEVGFYYLVSHSELKPEKSVI